MIFVTGDKWIRHHGKLDEVDAKILDQASQDGELIMMTPSEVWDYIQENEPEKFKKMTGSSPGLITLTKEKFEEMSETAYSNTVGFRLMFIGMGLAQAQQIRNWRVEGRYSWRAIARAAFTRVMSGGWQNLRMWQPPSNQIAGMCLCERAAQIVGEHHRRDPWN